MGKLKDFIWSCKDDFRKHPVRSIIILIVFIGAISAVMENNDKQNDIRHNTYVTPTKKNRPKMSIEKHKESRREIFRDIVRSHGRKCDSCNSIDSISGTECFSVSCNDDQYVYKVCEDISGEWKVSGGS